MSNDNAEDRKRIPYDERYRQPGTWSVKQLQAFGVDPELYQQAVRLAGEAMNTKDERRRLKKLAEAIHTIVRSDPNAGTFGVPRWYLHAAYTKFDAFTDDEIESALTKLVNDGKLDSIVYTRYSIPSEE